MKIKKTEWYFELKFKDQNGKVCIRVQKDLSQIQLETENGDCYADTSKQELTALRDILNKVLEK